METNQKLKTIQQITSLTQTELAITLGVSFATINSLINNKSKPRQRLLTLIDELFEEATGTKKIPTNELELKKQILIAKSKIYPNIIALISNEENILDQFLLELTYHTNKIEGSTLSEGETAAILFQNATISGKSLTEHLEAKNHQTALLYLFVYLSKNKTITENLILKLHSILLNSIQMDAGLYRRHGVRIIGSNMPTANYLKIPQLMEELVVHINKQQTDVIAHAAEIHAHFEQIHPFSDGNGRIGRLILQAMMLINNLPPAVIKQNKKVYYLQYLNKAQISSDQLLLDDLICDAINEGYMIMEG